MKKIKILVPIITLIILAILYLSLRKNYDVYIPLKKGDKIMAFGDSLTYGYGAEQNSYPHIMNNQTKYRVVNYGVNGDTTDKGLERLEEALEAESPQLVILSLGGNDMIQSIPNATISKNLIAMIQMIKKNNSQVVLLAEPKPRALDMVMGTSFIDLKDGDFYSIVAKQEKILNIDNVLSKTLSKQEKKSDLIHLNAEGYKEVAEKIIEKLQNTNIIE